MITIHFLGTFCRLPFIDQGATYTLFFPLPWITMTGKPLQEERFFIQTLKQFSSFKYFRSVVYQGNKQLLSKHDQSALPIH